MKIAQVCPYSFSRPGGVQSHIRELSTELRRRGHTVKILAPGGAAQPPEEDVIPIGSMQSIRFQKSQWEVGLALGSELRRLGQVLRQEEFDLLHYHTVWSPFLALQVLFKARAPGMATFHEALPDGPLGWLARNLLYPLFALVLLRRFLRAAVAVSPVPREYLERLHGSRGVHCIPNGIWTARFHPDQARPLEQYDDNRPTLLYLGRLEERKGIGYLLQAFPALKAQHPELRLIIAGEGYLRPRLEARVREKGYRDVEFLGQVPEALKPRLYASCDLFCSPAFTGESFGIVIVEAMAAGKPAVGAANPGYRSVLTGAGRELLVPPRDAVALESKLDQLLRDESLRRELGGWGLEQARQYDWTRVVGDLEAVYREVLAC